MKKVLLTSTALVMVAGMAAAEVKVTGSANMGLQYDGGATEDELKLHYELDFNVVGSGTSDSGLEFGASLDLDLDDGDQAAEIDDPEVFISGTFGTITVGGVDSASDTGNLGFSDVGFDGIGVDDDAESFIGAGDANVLYEYASGPLAVHVSGNLADSTTATADDDIGLLVQYDLGAVEIQAAYEDANDETIMYLGAQGDAGTISYDLFYHANDDADIAGYGASFGFSSGDMDFTVAVGATDIDGDDEDFGVGMSTDLGGGLKFAAGVGSVDGETKADAGFSLSF